jgi:tetratricopeptide (TPR) repeat protein
MVILILALDQRQMIYFQVRRDPTRMGRKRHWRCNFPQADFAGTSQYSAGAKGETDDLLANGAFLFARVSEGSCSWFPPAFVQDFRSHFVFNWVKARRNSTWLPKRSGILRLMITTLSGAKRWSTAILFAAIVFLGGCTPMIRMYESWNVRRYDSEIRRAAQAIADSRNTAQRSAAYADRADAYSEKAGYLRLMKLIADEEYSKIFDLAIQDYNQAIALDPDNAEMYYRRGDAYYSRAGLDMIYAPYKSIFLAPAKADFSRVVEKNPQNVMALDMLGLTEGSMGDWTQALAHFEQEAALKPSMSFRVSDAYCNRGSHYPREKHDLAISDLNRAIQSRGTSDACECEPYTPLLAIYLNQTREYDKAREVVALAQRSKQWIAPEYLDQLKASNANR